jgi:RHS repeat-associated protein
MDNILNKATEHGPYTYNYESLYRLARANGGPLTAESYSYDPVGNRLTSATATNWTYNPNNELQSYNGVAFQYDLNGNTTQRNDNGAIQNFLYNEDDRLTEVKDGNGTLIATYYYDPFGRRLWKDVGGTKTYFMYADEGLIAEFEDTGSETKSYGYAPNSTWTTNPLFMKQGTQCYFCHNDHLGTPQKMTSISGAVVWSTKYESFGEAKIDPSSTVVNNLRFPGQYFDTGTGLYYNYHRNYYPIIGRYLTPDPIGIEHGTNHLYGYVMNNPIRKTDPKGLQGTIEVPAELLSDLPAELLGMAASKTVGGLTEVRCAQDYCKKKAVPPNKMTGPYAECFRIFTPLKSKIFPERARIKTAKKRRR